MSLARALGPVPTRWPPSPALCRVLVLLITSAPGTVGPLLAQPTSDEEEIRAARAASNAAIARQDVGAVVSFLDDEYQVTAGSGRLLQDRSGMADAFADQFARFSDTRYVRTPDTVEVSSTERLAWESGTWVGTWTTPEGPYRTGGRYAAQWREVDGVWRIRSELFVTLFCEGTGCG